MDTPDFDFDRIPPYVKAAVLLFCVAAFFIGPGFYIFARVIFELFVGIMPFAIIGLVIVFLYYEGKLIDSIAIKVLNRIPGRRLLFRVLLLWSGVSLVCVFVQLYIEWQNPIPFPAHDEAHLNALMNQMNESDFYGKLFGLGPWIIVYTVKYSFLEMLHIILKTSSVVAWIGWGVGSVRYWFSTR